MMQTDVKAKSLTASGSVFGGPARVKGIVVTCEATASSVTLKDGGSSGTTVMTITTPAAAGIQNILIPGEGVKFNTSIYATFADANVTSVTTFYG
jgi:hypothetical protein